MSYSCSVYADCVLNQIENLDEFNRNSPNFKYFLEIGKENKDGAITGTVYEFMGEVCTDNGWMRTSPIKKTGSFKINANGSIARFPGVCRRLYKALEIAGIESFDRMFL